MTDNTIPVEKIQEIIDLMNSDLKTPASDDVWGDGYDRAAEAYRDALEALLPKPRTLADELRNLAADYDENGYSEPDGDQLILLADRVEALEKERDETRELLGLREALIAEMKEEAEQDRVSSTAEIARLRAREIPDGWQLADHLDYGRVIVTKPTPNHYGGVYFMNPADARPEGYDWHYCNLSKLTFLDTDTTRNLND